MCDSVRLLYLLTYGEMEMQPPGGAGRDTRHRGPIAFLHTAHTGESGVPPVIYKGL